MEIESCTNQSVVHVDLLCNLVGDECGASPTLVFMPVFILIARGNTKISANNISTNNKIFIQLSKWGALYYMIENTKMIGM